MATGRSLLSLVFVALLPAAAAAQELFTFTDDSPVSVRAAASNGDVGPTVRSFRDIVVDVDLLRSSPEALLLHQDEAPARVVYLRDWEGRTQGDLSWSGGPADSGYADAVFTVRSGWTVGAWHDDDGAHWTLWAGPDGKGKLTRSAMSAADDWCGARGTETKDWSGGFGGFGGVTSVSEAATELASASSSVKKRHRRIDVIIVITDLARQRWREWLYDKFGFVSPRSSRLLDSHIESWFDYGNMVLRNHPELRAAGMKLRLVRIENNGVPGLKTTAVPRLRHALWSLGRLEEYAHRLHYLRRLHGADVVYFVTAGEFTELQRVCGAANIYDASQTIQSMAKLPFGFIDLNCTFRHGLDIGHRVFIHEMGHTMGANHPRELAHQPESDARAPWGYGLYINPGAEKRKDPTANEVPDGVTGAATIMTYTRSGYVEVPFFSDNSIKLFPGQHGLVMEPTSPEEVKGKRLWRLGVADFAENSRLFKRSAFDIARLADYTPVVCGAPVNPQVTATRDNGDGTITIDATWEDHCHDETGYALQVVAYEPSAKQDGYLTVRKTMPLDSVPADSTSVSSTWAHGGLEDDWRLGVDVVALNTGGNTESGSRWLPVPVRPLPPVIDIAMISPVQAHIVACDPVMVGVVDGGEFYDSANRDPHTFHLTWTDTDANGVVSKVQVERTEEEVCDGGLGGFVETLEEGHQYSLSAVSENKYGMSDAGIKTLSAP